MMTPRTSTLLRAACLLALALFAGFGVALAVDADTPAAAIGQAAPLAAVMPVFGRLDASLILTKALPAAATSVTSDAIDTQKSSNGAQLAAVEYEILAPALAVGQLANGSTMKYDVQTDDDPDFGTPTTLIAAAITQTGAGGVGAAAASYRFRLPAAAERYVRVKATNSAAADASGASLTFQARF